MSHTVTYFKVTITLGKVIGKMKSTSELKKDHKPMILFSVSFIRIYGDQCVHVFRGTPDINPYVINLLSHTNRS